MICLAPIQGYPHSILNIEHCLSSSRVILFVMRDLLVLWSGAWTVMTFQIHLVEMENTH